jgi:hypothetical protein
VKDSQLVTHETPTLTDEDQGAILVERIHRGECMDCGAERGTRYLDCMTCAEDRGLLDDVRMP